MLKGHVEKKIYQFFSLQDPCNKIIKLTNIMYNELKFPSLFICLYN